MSQDGGAQLGNELDSDVIDNAATILLAGNVAIAETRDLAHGPLTNVG
jgi:hypothetical protein